MKLVSGAARVAAGAGEAATANLGAIGGAAVGGLVGSIKGAATGATEGARRGSHSTPAAVLTMGAVAATGVVQWPIVAAVGGTALVLDQLQPGTSRHEKPGTSDTTSGADAPTAATSAGAASETTTLAPTPETAPVPAAPKASPKRRTTAKSGAQRRTAAQKPSRTTP
ncbi:MULTISPECIES: hypothetical protein [Rhodococcus]|uniref:Transmembrane protein n=1 Tax=Rhodococcus opacus RKJ300 = JCM 13270 TaxID=1165867 RepID=I0WU02_RHOOP|nr:MULTISPECIES: hypothetical protein [Rhodococcus]EID79868.1 hypothetical protein W59_11081 [Rhodococcus opacus RKJ300 = JCM 13270]KAF0959225.1 hypothetical protein MLGJGCBP_07659 [Rhodococcus sp. T7]UOT08134.1 hypothetical protein MPY17_37905 [Rhodococcus opacus]